MELTLSAAARMTGRSKSTLSRAIKAGRLSASRTDEGEFRIDGAELARVFPWDSHDAAQRRTTHHPADALDPLGTEVAVLRAKVEGLTALLDREREANAELRQVNADLRNLLPHLTPAPPSAAIPAPAPSVPLKGLLARLLGR